MQNVAVNNMLANKKRKGFTLVELIVVIVVIAIIAAIAIPRIIGFQDSAKKARIQAEHRELVTAIQLYKAQQADPADAEPKTLEDLAPYMSLNGKKTVAEVVTAGAHVLASGVLTSTFTTSSDVKSEIWKFQIKGTQGTSTQTPAAPGGTTGQP